MGVIFFGFVVVLQLLVDGCSADVGHGEMRIQLDGFVVICQCLLGVVIEFMLVGSVVVGQRVAAI